MEWTTKIGLATRRLRAERGLTQQGLADKAGIDRKTVVNLERGSARSASWQTLGKLGAALGVSRGELLGG